MTERSEVIQDIMAGFPPTYILEDDDSIIELLEHLFKLNGFTNYIIFKEADMLIRAMTDKVPILVIDHYLRGPMTGIEVIEIIMSLYPACVVIMITGSTDFEVYKNFSNLKRSPLSKIIYKHDKDANQQIISALQTAMLSLKDTMKFFMELKTDIENTNSERNTGTSYY
jgi:DNA-binding NtrC family response regulator